MTKFRYMTSKEMAGFKARVTAFLKDAYSTTKDLDIRLISVPEDPARPILCAGLATDALYQSQATVTFFLLGRGSDTFNILDIQVYVLPRPMFKTFWKDWAKDIITLNAYMMDGILRIFVRKHGEKNGVLLTRHLSPQMRVQHKKYKAKRIQLSFPGLPGRVVEAYEYHIEGDKGQTSLADLPGGESLKPKADAKKPEGKRVRRAAGPAKVEKTAAIMFVPETVDPETKVKDLTYRQKISLFGIEYHERGSAFVAQQREESGSRQKSTSDLIDFVFDDQILRMNLRLTDYAEPSKAHTALLQRQRGPALK